MEPEQVIVWEAPIIEKPEFRLYYDERGNVICYSCEKLNGTYIVIDAMTYAEARPDLKVIDGKIMKAAIHSFVSKLVPSDDGVICSPEDINVITSTGQPWKLRTHEF